MDTLFDDADRNGDLAALMPTTDRPWWRTASGERSSYPAVRAAFDPSRHDELDDAHAAAIFRIARAAVRAQAGGEQADARRLAHAASRLCQETVGLWTTPSLLADR